MIEDSAKATDMAHVRAAYDRLMGAFGRGSTAEYFDCFHEDASFIFPGEDLLEPRSTYESTWSRWQGEGVHFTDVVADDVRVRVVGDTGVVTHRLQTTVVSDGASTVDRERESIVFARVGGRWLAVHEHLSPDPTGNNQAASK